MLKEKLLQLRKKQGLSQQEVADKLHLTRQTISNWECGQGAPSIDKAKELSMLYHVSLDDLVGNEVEVVTVSQQKNLFILSSLIGKTCILDCSDMSFMLDCSIAKVKIIDVNEEWLKVEYSRRKDNLIGKETVIKLIDINLVRGFEIVGDEDE